jgi:hypothetical protein
MKYPSAVDVRIVKAELSEVTKSSKKSSVKWHRSIQ